MKCYIRKRNLVGNGNLLITVLIKVVFSATQSLLLDVDALENMMVASGVCSWSKLNNGDIKDVVYVIILFTIVSVETITLIIMLLKRLLIIIKSNKVILRRRDSIDGIRDCQDCYSHGLHVVENDHNLPYLSHCYLSCAVVCCKYGEYKRYYATEEDNKNVSKERI